MLSPDDSHARFGMAMSGRRAEVHEPDGDKQKRWIQENRLQEMGLA